MAFQDVMHTSNPIYEYAFSWTIDNISKNSSKLQGPTFTPIPGYAGKFRFELAIVEVTELKFHPEYEFGHPLCDTCLAEDCECTVLVPALDIKLICLNDNVILNNDPPLNIVATISLSKEGGKLFKDTTPSKKVDQTTSLFRCSFAYFDLSSSYCPLKMEGTLVFSDYQVTSTVYPLSIQQPSENWRDLSIDLKTMYESGVGSDVTFSVGGAELRAHRAILCSRSPVFTQMFERDMLESNTNSVTIVDVDSHTFDCFLMFLYTGTVQDQGYEIVKSLYWVADKYQVKSLQKACVVLLVNQLSVESVCRVLVLADLHGDEGLKQMVKTFIRENFYDIVETAAWGELVTTKPELKNDVMTYIKSIDRGN